MIQVHVDTIRGHLTRIGEAHLRVQLAAIAAQGEHRRPEPVEPEPERKPSGQAPRG